MKRMIFILIFILSQSLLSQEISFSKDSLNIKWNENFYAPIDSIWILNYGNSDLLIDSLLSKNYYGYRLDVFYQDSTYLNYLSLDRPTLNLTIKSLDSAKFIFYDVDLCSICKTSSIEEFFTDSLIFITNSISGRYTFLDVCGEGHLSSIEDNDEISYSIKLFQNFPNPFNPTTKIRFQLISDKNVKILITNILGNFIKEFNLKEYTSGIHEIEFDGSNLSSGVYYCSLITSDQILTRKLLLIK